jgi:hypothetical protein
MPSSRRRLRPGITTIGAYKRSTNTWYLGSSNEQNTSYVVSPFVFADPTDDPSDISVVGDDRRRSAERAGHLGCGPTADQVKHL